MNEDEARARAEERWGRDVPQNGQPAATYGMVQHIPAQARDPFRIGIWRRGTGTVGYFDVRGEGSSWVAAFQDADRRSGSFPRK